MKIVTTKCTNTIPLGRLGENDYTLVRFDVSGWLAEYPDAVIGLYNQRPGDNSAYPVADLTVNNGVAEWQITNVELTQTGQGKCQLVAIKDSVVIKSMIYSTIVLDALDNSGDVPDPWDSWEDKFIELKGEAEQAASDAESAKNQILGMRAQAITLAPGSEATANYDDGVLTLGIPQGEQGAPGQDGAPGAKGDKGDKGDTGATGAQGQKGEKGDKGDKGDTGDQGQKGDKGDPGDPTDLIDDNAGAGVTDKVWSASKSAGEVSDLLSAINVMKPAATSSDIGKALLVKTVENGKPTSWEYGEAGGGSVDPQDIAEAVDSWCDENITNPDSPPLDRSLTSSTAAAPADIVGGINDAVNTAVSKSYDYTGNLANTTGVVKTGQYTDYVTFDLVGNGSYYSNPFDSNFNTSESSAQYEIKFLDSNGDEITITKNSDSSTMTTLTSLSLSKITITVNGTGLVVTYYLKNGNVFEVGYTLSATPVKIKYRTRWWDSDKAQKNGFTYGFSSATYVPYSAPLAVYSPNPDFADDIKDYYVSNGFIDTAFNTSGSVADAKAVGDELYDRKGITFETSHGWIRPSNGAFISGSSYTATDYISVTPGETIRVNRPALSDIEDNAYYNASKQYVSGLTTPSNQTDLTIPSGVYYVRFSDYNSGFVGFSVERTGLWTRIRDAISESSGEAEYRNLIEQSKYGSNVLTLLHFSDLHMDATTMGFINTFRTRYAEFLDDVIQTGDTSNGFSNDWTPLVSVGLGDCLGVIGNHEALGSSKNSATQQELHEKYIAPYISGWNVTQPTGVDDSTSVHYCANYYYKDYASATVRLIVLDTQKWSSAQLSWFTDTLASARTAGYAVIVASHVLPGAVTITDCNFSAKYTGGGYVTHAFPTDDAPLASEDAVSAVNDFITAGGEFTVWIGGHEHADIFGVFTNYPNVTAYMIDKASINRETPGAARISGEKNQHAFNVMSIVRSGKLIKIVRIGEDVDGMMRGKHVFCYNYNTKTVISQW